jgi:hypothetical protein
MKIQTWNGCIPWLPCWRKRAIVSIEEATTWAKRMRRTPLLLVYIFFQTLSRACWWKVTAWPGISFCISLELLKPSRLSWVRITLDLAISGTQCDKPANSASGSAGCCRLESEPKLSRVLFCLTVSTNQCTLLYNIVVDFIGNFFDKS